MTKPSLVEPTRPEWPRGAPIYDDHLQPAIQEALSALADIEARYAVDRERLQSWTGPDSIKQRLSAQLEKRRQRDREPHARHLAELHQEIMALSLYRRLH